MRKIAFITAGLLAMSLLVGSGGNRSFKATLTGSEEVPAVVTDTSGKATFHVNNDESEIRFKLKIKDGDEILAVAGAHVHCAAAGFNGPIAAFLAGAAPPAGFDGTVRVRATLTDANVIPTACGTTIADLADAMAAGDTYVNAHSTANPGGEVRGQIGG